MRQAYADTRKFCGMACYRAHQQSLVPQSTCPVCKAHFRPKGAQRTCSYKCSKKGERNPNWSGGHSGRTTGTADYRWWSRTVKKRAGFLCVACGSGDNVVPHHMDGYHWCEERRLDVTNGVTLCGGCHRRFHREYGKKNNTEKQFRKWIKGLT